MTEFRRLLHELVIADGGSKREFADAIGVTKFTLSRLLASSSKRTKPSTEMCLRIAAATGCSASTVLRAAGKDEIAGLLERLYGVPVERHSRLNRRDEEVLTMLGKLDKRAYRAVLNLLQAATLRAEQQQIVLKRGA